ncbi:hypothetical protein D3C84_1167360 [compost metagenome]
MPQMFCHFSFQGAFGQHLGELLEQTIFADQIFRLSVIGQQTVGQLHQLRIGFDSFSALGLGH